jgi:hypothetical protein
MSWGILFNNAPPFIRNHRVLSVGSVVFYIITNNGKYSNEQHRRNKGSIPTL